MRSVDWAPRPNGRSSFQLWRVTATGLNNVDKNGLFWNVNTVGDGAFMAWGLRCRQLSKSKDGRI